MNSATRLIRAGLAVLCAGLLFGSYAPDLAAQPTKLADINNETTGNISFTRLNTPAAAFQPRSPFLVTTSRTAAMRNASAQRQDDGPRKSLMGHRKAPPSFLEAEMAAAYDAALPLPAAQPVSAANPPLLGFDAEVELFDETGSVPPDPHHSVGQTYIVTAVNGYVKVFLKNGTAVSGTDDDVFFGATGQRVFDPKFFYDQLSQRHVGILILKEDGPPTVSQMLIAYSGVNDATTWTTLAIDTKRTISGTEYWFDYPGWAVDEEAIYITGNWFSFPSNAFGDSFMYVLDKAALYGGSFNVANDLYPYDFIPSAGFTRCNFAAQPAHVYGTLPSGSIGTYMITFFGCNSAGNSELGIIRIDNPLGGAGASFPAAFVPFTTTGAIGSAQGNAPQPGGGTVATNDRRTLDAVLDDNLLFVTFTTGAGASNPYAPDDVGEATAVLVQVDVSDATPSNWTTTDVTFFGGERFGENTYTFFPSVAVSGSEALVGFSYAGANAFAGMAYAKVPVVSSAPPNPNVPSGIIPIAVQAKAGEGRYPWSPNRWGDYTGTVVDPVDGTYWVFNEFAKDVGTGAGLPSGQTVTWGTWVSQTSNANAPSPAPLPVELTAFDAVTDGRDVQLAWTTLTETDNAGFEIELRTGDADFETLDFVSGAGTTDEPQSYSYRVVDLEPGAHTFRLKQIDFDGVFDYSPEIEAFVGVPEGYRLTDAYPNPFNPQTRFELMIARDQDVRIEIVDLLGRVVRVLHNGQLTANQTHVFTLDAAGLPSGTYLYRAVGESFVSAPRSIMLIK